MAAHPPVPEREFADEERDTAEQRGGVPRRRQEEDENQPDQEEDENQPDQEEHRPKATGGGCAPH